MNKGKVRDNERVAQKREVLDKILVIKYIKKYTPYYYKLMKKSRKELDRIWEKIK